MKEFKKILSVFDFDGTMFLSPLDTKENRELYEKTTGLPWVISKEESNRLTKKHGRFIGMRNGWFGRAETLEPPLVPDPAPANWFIKEVCEDFLRSKSCNEEVTVCMTGRHQGLTSQVLRILRQGNLVDCELRNGKFVMADPLVQLLLLGSNGPAIKGAGPKPTDGTLSWKIWIIDKFLLLYPEIEKVVIWEDRDSHVEEFRALQEVLSQEVVVNHVLSPAK